MNFPTLPERASFEAAPEAAPEPRPRAEAPRANAEEASFDAMLEEVAPAADPVLVARPPAATAEEKNEAEEALAGWVAPVDAASDEPPRAFAGLPPNAASGNDLRPSAMLASAGVARGTSRTSPPPLATLAAPGHQEAASPVSAIPAGIDAAPPPAEFRLATKLHELRELMKPLPATSSSPPAIEPEATPQRRPNAPPPAPAAALPAADSAGPRELPLPPMTPNGGQAIGNAAVTPAPGARDSEAPHQESQDAGTGSEPRREPSRTAAPPLAAVAPQAPGERPILGAQATESPSTPGQAAAPTGAVAGAPPIATPGTNMAVAATSRGVEPRDLTLHVLDQVRAHLSPHRPEITIQLDPPELGHLVVRLELVHGELKARLLAESATITERLQADLPRLHQTLEQAGLRVAQVEIATADPFSPEARGEAAAPGAEPDGRGRERRLGTEGETDRTERAADVRAGARQERSRSRWTARGAVDLVV